MHIVKTLYKVNADTTAMFTHDFPDKYQKWLVGTTVNPNKIEWLFQNESKDSLCRIPLNVVNQVGTIEGYMLKTWVKYQNQSDGTKLDSMRTDDAAFYSRWQSKGGAYVTGFRESPDGYNPVEIIEFSKISV